MRARYWIFSPLKDLSLVLLTPLPILLVFAAAQRGGWMDGLVAFALALAMAHYLPGILRAYGDAALFRRYRLRLIAAPAVLVAATALLAYFDFTFVFLLVGLWGAWHWLMQVYGFARIYDAKVEAAARMPARLDQAVCLLWFGMCVLVINDVLPVYLDKFHASGGRRLPAALFEWLPGAWLVLTIAVTLFYAARALRMVRHGQRPNPLKFVLIGVTFVYLAYTASWIDQPIVGYALFESWHDIQYLAIVWLFNLNRVRQGPDAGAFSRFLFRPRPLLLLAYLAACLVFGSLTHAWRLFEDPALSRVAASFVMAAALLHYYLDGFIWKIREPQTRQALVGGNLPAETLFMKPAWAHVGLWLLLIVPGIVLFALESNNKAARAGYEAGRELQSAGRLDDARAQYDRTLALAPDFAAAQVVHNNLGIIFDQKEDLPMAKFHFEQAVRIDPQYALAHSNLGIVLARLGDPARARIHYEQALRIAPDLIDTHYQLGLTLADEGDLAGAVRHFEEALRLDPEDYLTHNSLAAALITQGRLREAREHLERALRIRPDYVHARQNLEKVMELQP